MRTAARLGGCFLFIGLSRYRHHDRVASISMRMVTSSPTWLVSLHWPCPTPKSVRLIVTVPSASASLPSISSVKGRTTSFVTSRIVRSAVASYWPGAISRKDLVSNFAVGHCATSNQSAEMIWLSRSAFSVLTDAISIRTLTFDPARSSGEKLISAVNLLNSPSKSAPSWVPANSISLSSVLTCH